MKPNPRICRRRGCTKAISWKKNAGTLFCADCTAEGYALRWHRSKDRGRSSELSPINLPRTFPFQAVIDRVPPLELVRGRKPWIRYLADCMRAADPSLAYRAATQRIHRARCREFLTWVEADTFAAILGCHPSEFWDNWHDEMAALDGEAVAA